MLPWAHTSPNPKWHRDWFSRFYTAHGRELLYFTTGRPFPPLKLPGCPWSGPPSNTWFLGPTRLLNPNGMSIGSAISAQLTTECPYTLQWATLPPSKLPLPMGILTQSNTWFLGPPKSSTQMASRSLHIFAGLNTVTDRHTMLLGL